MMPAGIKNLAVCDSRRKKAILFMSCSFRDFLFKGLFRYFLSYTVLYERMEGGDN